MKKQKGFSLIELLIVVAIILIIAAIAIPNLLRAKISAAESSAVSSVRTIYTAEISYGTTYGVGYAPNLASLGSPAAGACTAAVGSACLIDPILTTGTKSGYTFKAAPAAAGTVAAPATTVEITSNPVTVGTTGQRSFCSDETGVIRFDPAGAVMATGAGSCNAIVNVLQ